MVAAGSTISRDIEAGAYSFIGPGSSIYPKVHIGKLTMLAGKVTIVGGDHNYKKPGVQRCSLAVTSWSQPTSVMMFG